MASSPPIPNWVDLPADLTAEILRRLGALAILEVAQRVCVTWHKVCKEHPSMWQSIDMRREFEAESWMEGMCCHAVHRSRGLLTHISIEHFVTPRLLSFIAHRAPLLRSLRLVGCFDIFQQGLGQEVAKKLPNLEELHVLVTTNEVLESIGHCFPQLKSLTYTPLMDDEGDLDALTIARLMPELRHLSVLNLQMTNFGLTAILIGCSHLESLDLRRCFKIDLKGDIGKSFARRFKNLKLPYDSITSYEFRNSCL